MFSSTEGSHLWCFIITVAVAIPLKIKFQDLTNILCHCLVSCSQTLYLIATLGKGLVALVHSTSSIPSSSQGEIAAPVVVVSNL